MKRHCRDLVVFIIKLYGQVSGWRAVRNYLITTETWRTQLNLQHNMLGSVNIPQLRMKRYLLEELSL